VTVKLRFLLLCALFCNFLSGCIGTCGDPLPNTTVIVADGTTFAAIEGAAVQFDGADIGMTDASGSLETYLSPGGHDFTVTKFGYMTSSSRITIDPDSTLPQCNIGRASSLDVYLAPAM
jgi:hypothetical protein